MRLARARFAALLEDPAFEGLNWPGIEKAIDFVLEFETRNRGAIERIWVERRGAIEFPLADGKPFRLTARADRIDVLRTGGATLIDYKSGTPPGVERGEGRLRAAADPGGRDPHARRLRGPRTS